MRYTTYLTTAHVCVLGMCPLFSISLCIFLTWLGTVPGHHALRVRRPDVYSRFAPWVSGFVHQRSLLLGQPPSVTVLVTSLHRCLLTWHSISYPSRLIGIPGRLCQTVGSSYYIHLISMSLYPLLAWGKNDDFIVTAAFKPFWP